MSTPLRDSMAATTQSAAKTAAIITGLILALRDDRDSWHETAEMYSEAWQRELGPRRPKRHLIDELVCGTKDLRECVAKLEGLLTEARKEITRLTTPPLHDWYGGAWS